jgi:hypothetical protein
MSPEQLQPCPVCGGPAERNENTTFLGIYVLCPVCGRYAIGMVMLQWLDSARADGTLNEPLLRYLTADLPTYVPHAFAGEKEQVARPRRMQRSCLPAPVLAAIQCRDPKGAWSAMPSTSLESRSRRLPALGHFSFASAQFASRPCVRGGRIRHDNLNLPASKRSPRRFGPYWRVCVVSREPGLSNQQSLVGQW